MELYEKERYEFFTKKENFESMCKVVENYPLVTRQLKEEFWLIVQNKLKSSIQTNQSTYEIKITGKINDSRTKIMLFKSYWPVENGQPVIAIAIQRLADNNYPFYGPWINRHSQNMNLDRMYTQCRNSKAATNFETDDDQWFPFYNRIDVNFKDDNAYLEILPDNRDNFAERIVEQVFDLAKKIEYELDEIATYTKNMPK